MRGFGRLLEAVVEFRSDTDARDALILDGKMWGTSKLKVTKKEKAGNILTVSFLVTLNREIPHIFPSSKEHPLLHDPPDFYLYQIPRNSSFHNFNSNDYLNWSKDYWILRRNQFLRNRPPGHLQFYLQWLRGRF